MLKGAQLVFFLFLFFSLGTDSWSQPPVPSVGQSESSPPQPAASGDQGSAPDSQPRANSSFENPSPSSKEKTDASPESTDKEKEAATREDALVLWTMYLCFATGALAIFSLGQVFLFWVQLRFIRDGLADTKEAADAAKDGTDIARTSMISNNRAYVHHAGMRWISHPKVAGSKEVDFWRLWPSWSNSGNTPTRNLSVCVKYHIGDELPDEFNFTEIDNTPRAPASIAAHGSTTSDNMDITPSDLNEIKDGTKHLYVWGTAKYNDVYPRTDARITRFCVKAGPVTGDPKFMWNQTTNPVEIRFKTHVRNNCSDEECQVQ